MADFEEWRDVAGHEGAYQVSSLGRVRSLARTIYRRGGQAQFVPERTLQPDAMRRGYQRVRLPSGAVTVHSLVLAAFVGPCPPGMERAHNDGDPSNNDIGNLRYATHAENVADKIRHGTAQRGAAHPQAKLTPQIIGEIRLAAQQSSQARVAAQFGVSQAHVGRIVRGETWA